MPKQKGYQFNWDTVYLHLISDFCIYCKKKEKNMIIYDIYDCVNSSIRISVYGLWIQAVVKVDHSLIIQNLRSGVFGGGD